MWAERLNSNGGRSMRRAFGFAMAVATLAGAMCLLAVLTSVAWGRSQRPVFGRVKPTPLSLMILTNQLQAADKAELAVRTGVGSTCDAALRGPRKLTSTLGLVHASRAYVTWTWRVSRTVRGGVWTAAVACRHGNARYRLAARMLVGVTRDNRDPLVAHDSVRVVQTALPPAAPDAPVARKGGGGYPNDNALCEWTGRPDHGKRCSGYNWGYLSSDGRWQLNSIRGFGYRNCTDYVAWYLGLTWSSFKFPTGLGNAADWEKSAGNAGLQVTHTPSVGDIAWWGSEVGGGDGHVAIVTAITGSGSTATVTISEYNGDNDGDYDLHPGVHADAYLHRPTPTSAPSSPAGSPPLQGSSPVLQGGSPTLQGSSPVLQGSSGGTGGGSTPPPTPTPSPAPTPAPTPEGFVIADSIYGGTWARTDPNNGTWYSHSTPPPNGAYWYPNGLGVAVSCAESAAAYSVVINGQHQTWSWWGHVTDGKWVPVAVFSTVWNDGLPSGLAHC